MTHLLLGLCGVLILVNGAEWAYLMYGISQSRQIVEQPVDPNIEFDRIGSHEFVLPPKESFSEIVERPLMIQGRRAVSENSAEPIIAGPASRGDMQIRLMGVVMTPDGMTALMQDGKGAYQRLQIDGSIDGWELAEMHKDRVVLKQGGSREELKLRKPKPKEPLPVVRTHPQPKPAVPRKPAQPHLIPGTPNQSVSQ